VNLPTPAHPWPLKVAAVQTGETHDLKRRNGAEFRGDILSVHPANSQS